MIKQSLLSHIAANFIYQYENVANSSIAYLLNEYPVSREALKNLLDVEEVPTYYETEKSTESNGRPDVTGFDMDHGKSIIIEGKFWANLTDNQPGNYLKELTSDGKILFLAPDKRLNSLKLEIDERLNGDSKSVVVCSWISFIDQIEKQNNKNHNHHLASDLTQIKELCQQMDSEGMPPLSMSDLDPMNGRVTSQFIDVIADCYWVIRDWEHSDFKKYKSGGFRYGYGFYFLGYKFGCYLSFDSHKWFARESHTPIWLNVKKVTDADGWQTSQKVNHALNDFDSINTYDDEYGIILESGWDKNQVVNHIADKTKEILEYLSNRIPDE